MKASSLIANKNISFLLKGSPGFGKTLAAASFALEGPVYLSYWDKSQPVELITFFTEKRFGKLAKTILDNIEYEVFGSSNAHEYLNKMIGFRDDCRYVAIINDSLTRMTSCAVNWSLNFGKESKERKKIKDILPDFDEYKVETSLISQCIDIGIKLPCHVIWTAHPVPSLKIDGSGSSMRVSKSNPIVTYGSKVAGMVPGSFTEIYHFSQQTDFSTGKISKKYIVNTEAVGDEYAKSPLLGDYVKEFDITDKLFYSVWKDLIAKAREVNQPKEMTDETTVNEQQTSTLTNSFNEKKW